MLVWSGSGSGHTIEFAAVCTTDDIHSFLYHDTKESKKKSAILWFGIWLSIHFFSRDIAWDANAIGEVYCGGGVVG